MNVLSKSIASTLITASILTPIYPSAAGANMDVPALVQEGGPPPAVETTPAAREPTTLACTCSIHRFRSRPGR